MTFKTIDIEFQSITRLSHLSILALLIPNVNRLSSGNPPFFLVLEIISQYQKIKASNDTGFEVWYCAKYLKIENFIFQKIKA
jgi:hypothetical protein